MKNLNQQFLEALGACKDPLSFAGIAHYLHVKLVDKDSLGQSDESGVPCARPFECVLKDVMESFSKLSRTEKRTILRTLRQANLEPSIFEPEGEPNAGNTEDSETPTDS